MMRVAYLVLVTSVACSSDDISIHDRKVSSVDRTTFVGDTGSDAIKQQAQSSLPAEHERITFSTYAEVTAADLVEIVLLLDSELEDEHKKQLAGGSDALLQHIINSHWKIAVANLNTTTYPTSFITKYANYTDYGKQFATAIKAGTMPSAGQQPGAAPQPQHQPNRKYWRRGTLRVFIIVTPQSFADTQLGQNAMIVAEEHAHRTRVYALLNTDDNNEDFINWKNAQDKQVLSGYASLASNNNKALEEFSADIAYALRGMFAIPPPPNMLPRSDNHAIAQMKVFNAPEGEEEQDGFIHDSHYQVKQNVVFTRAQFSEGVCVDVTLQP